MDLPGEIVGWIRDVFAEANIRSSVKLSNLPTCHEPWLDLSIIETISHARAPRRFDSGHVVRLETHFLGGYPLFGRWEIADIGLHVQLRRAGTVQAVKIALLQSKRLYPEEQEEDQEEEARLARIGFGRALVEPHDGGTAWQQRTFTVDEDSRYKALKKDDEQWERIAEYEKASGIPVHYMLYNPMALPWTRTLPVDGGVPEDTECDIGVRVLRSTQVRTAMAAASEGDPPSYAMLFADGDGWRLEDFVADGVLGCTEGYQPETLADTALERAFFGRTAPISAAITVVIDVPEE